MGGVGGNYWLFGGQGGGDQGGGDGNQGGGAPWGGGYDRWQGNEGGGGFGGAYGGWGTWEGDDKLQDQVRSSSNAAEQAASDYFSRLYNLTDTLGTDLIEKSQLVGDVTNMVNQQALDAARVGYEGSLRLIGESESTARGQATSGLISSGLMTNTAGIDNLTQIGRQFTTLKMKAAEDFGRFYTNTVMATGNRAIDAAQWMFSVEAGAADKKLAAYGSYVTAAYGLHDTVHNYSMAKAFGVQAVQGGGTDWGQIIGGVAGTLLGGPVGGIVGDIFGGLF